MYSEARTELISHLLQIGCAVSSFKILKIKINTFYGGSTAVCAKNDILKNIFFSPHISSNTVQSATDCLIP